MTGQCSVDGCDRRAQCTADDQRVCLMHYKRWARSGSFGAAEAKPIRPQRGICILPDCDAIDDGPHGYCKKHMTRIRRHGDPSVRLMTGPPAGPDHHSRNDSGLTYGGAHRRVRSERGRAVFYPCIDCGGQARQWSYNRLDPDERQSELGPFSISPKFYEPRCVPCHKRFDLEAIKAGAA